MLRTHRRYTLHTYLLEIEVNGIMPLQELGEAISWVESVGRDTTILNNLVGHEEEDRLVLLIESAIDAPIQNERSLEEGNQLFLVVPQLLWYFHAQEVFAPELTSESIRRPELCLLQNDIKLGIGGCRCV